MTGQRKTTRSSDSETPTPVETLRPRAHTSMAERRNRASAVCPARKDATPRSSSRSTCSSGCRIELFESCTQCSTSFLV
eukprot:763753-Hanusia_phi.AAC.1